MDPDIATNLRSYFGFDSFRAGQEQAVKSLLAGENTLVVMPTGAGKSLIYELTALLLPGLTLIISPLIALMKDQVDNLARLQIPATFINSTLSAIEQDRRLKKLAAGDYRLVYIAPERLRSVPFLAALQKQKVSLFAVDEAHCISEWGHDFRPDYLHLLKARAILGYPLTAALTATATPQVQDDILTRLGLVDACRIVTGFNRPNLLFEVRYASDLSTKLGVLHKAISQVDQGGKIVYVGTRRDAEEVAEFLRQVAHIQAEHYHAGLEAGERSRIQESFLCRDLPVVVATNAFGMGIDRPDVRLVAHYSLPGSLEAYYQEAGRAGRDGKPARAMLLYTPQDRALQEYFIENSAITLDELRTLYDKLRREAKMTVDDFSYLTGFPEVKVRLGLAALERARAVERLGDEGLRMLLRRGTWDSQAIYSGLARSKEHQQHRKIQLSRMIAYAETNACRRQIMLDHFGDQSQVSVNPCCDNCQAQPSFPFSGGDITLMPQSQRIALIILDTARRQRVKVGREKLAQILKGSRAKDIQKYHYDQNIYYGRLAVFSKPEIEGLIDQLTQGGYLKSIGGKFPVLILTPQGETAIQSKAAIPLLLPRQKSLIVATTNKVQSQCLGIRHIVELGESKSPEAVPDLITILNSPNANIRRLAASALGKLRDERGLDPLMKLLEGEQKPQVRQYAVKALGCIGNMQAISLLESIANDESEQYYTRDSARVALKKIELNSKGKSISQKDVSNTLYDNSSDSIITFLSRPHPRQLSGPWQAGWALDFHSRFSGSDWNRSLIGDLTYRLKYMADLAALPLLVDQAMVVLADHPELSQVDAILPVPPSLPHPNDPVLAFAEALSERLGTAVLPAVVKTRQTKPQKEIRSLAQKRANVSGAFAIQGDVCGKSFLLVDDLFDSGATLEEITHLLIRAKAARINVLTLTRTIHSDA
jgi:ATP-dependent DNA helicase RecQ